MNRYTATINGKACTMLTPEDLVGAEKSCRDRFPKTFEGIAIDSGRAPTPPGNLQPEATEPGDNETGRRVSNANSGD